MNLINTYLLKKNNLTVHWVPDANPIISISAQWVSDLTPFPHTPQSSSSNIPDLPATAGRDWCSSSVEIKTYFVLKKQLKNREDM